MSTVEDSDCGPGSANVFCLGFSQDNTCLSVGSRSGFSIHDITSHEPLRKIFTDADTMKDVCIFGLSSCGDIVIVSMTTPREFSVYRVIKTEGKRSVIVAKKSYYHKIVNVRVNSDRVIIILKDMLQIRDMKTLKVLHNIYDTPLNAKGICALGASYLAYPGCDMTGQVHIFDVTILRAVNSISAHNGPLASLAFNLSGTKLATASTKGTVIRVFSIPEGQLLYELRRSLRRCADISCLAFSVDSEYLCVSSNTETVHIFRLMGRLENNAASASGVGSWMGYFNSVVSASVSYLSTEAANVWNQDRAFATARLPVSDVKNVCAIVTVKSGQYVFVACYNGYVYVYRLDTTNGGDCELLSRYPFIPSECLASTGFSEDGLSLEEDRPLLLKSGL